MATSREDLPNEGTYAGKADPTTIQWGTSQNGDAMVAFIMKVDGVGNIKWQGTFTKGKGTEITTNSLKAAGWNGDVNTIEKLIGLGSVTCDVVCQHEHFESTQGENAGQEIWIMKAAYLNPYGIRAFKNPLGPDGLSKLKARLSGTEAPRTSTYGGGYRRQETLPNSGGGAYGGGGRGRPVDEPAQEWNGTGVDPNADPDPF